MFVVKTRPFVVKTRLVVLQQIRTGIVVYCQSTLGTCSCGYLRSVDKGSQDFMYIGGGGICPP